MRTNFFHAVKNNVYLRKYLEKPGNKIDMFEQETNNKPMNGLSFQMTQKRRQERL